MPDFRWVSPVLLVFVFFINACGAVPGQRAGGALSPSGILEDGVGQMYSAGGDGQGTDSDNLGRDEAPSPGPGASSAPSSAPGADSPKPYVAPSEPVIAINKPLTGGLPAPTQDTPHLWHVIDGPSSICRTSEDNLILIITGFAKRPLYNFPGTPLVAVTNDYTLQATDRATNKVYKAPLRSKMVQTSEGQAEQTGFVSLSIPLKAADYPDNLDFDYALVANPKRMPLLEEAPSGIRTEKPIRIAPLGLIDLPLDPADVPDCLLIQSTMDSFPAPDGKKASDALKAMIKP